MRLTRSVSLRFRNVAVDIHVYTCIYMYIHVRTYVDSTVRAARNAEPRLLLRLKLAAGLA